MKTRLVCFALAVVLTILALPKSSGALTCWEGCSNHVRQICCPGGGGCIKAGTC